VRKIKLDKYSAILFLTILFISSCQTNNIRRVAYGDEMIRYEPVTGMDDQVIGQVVLAFVQKVGAIRNSEPIVVEVLSDEWRLKCHLEERLVRVFAKDCDAEFVVSQNYKVWYIFKAHGEYQRRFVSKDCSSAACKYLVSDKDYAVEE
jgi:hypothetical protein